MIIAITQNKIAFEKNLFNKVIDDDINQHLDTIHQNHNVDPLMWKLKGKWWENIGLLM